MRPERLFTFSKRLWGEGSRERTALSGSFRKIREIAVPPAACAMSSSAMGSATLRSAAIAVTGIGGTLRNVR
jgi:hypothetical protein